MGFKPIYRILKELPSPKRIKLIERLIEHLEVEELESLQQQLPQQLNHQLEIVRKKREESKQGREVQKIKEGQSNQKGKEGKKRSKNKEGEEG